MKQSKKSEVTSGNDITKDNSNPYNTQEVHFNFNLPTSFNLDLFQSFSTLFVQFRPILSLFLPGNRLHPLPPNRNRASNSCKLIRNKANSLTLVASLVEKFYCNFNQVGVLRTDTSILIVSTSQ